MLNKIGVCEWCFPVTGPFGVTLAGQAGYEGIQLGDLGGITAGFPMNCKRVQEGYMQAAENAGVVLQALHPYGLQRQGTMLSVPGTTEWDEARLSLKMCVKACAEMNIPELMVSSFFNTAVLNEWDIQTYARHLNYACDVAQDYGIVVSYECALTLPKMFQMLELTDGRVKICYDVRNPITEGCGCPVEDIPALGAEYISHFHIKDAPENMKNWCLIGEGISEIDRVAEVIDRIGYAGWLISENDYSFLAAGSQCDFLEPAAEDCRRMEARFKRKERLI